MSECPDLYTLERLAENRLSEAESTTTHAHVGDCAECRRTLEELRDDGEMKSEMRRFLTRPAAPTAPVIPGITLEKTIGRGGQGTVWRGRQIASGRDVAVKVLALGAFESAVRRTRFLREVEIAASQRHPNIVSVFDGGETAEGVAYLTMEWVDGERLDAWCARERRPIAEIVRVFRGVAEGVRHAHLHGVLHRDLKPGNILVDRDGAARVLDFGLAKRIAADLGESNGTATGEFVGTIAYAAPEQLEKSDVPDAADLRSDIHALGAVFYAMLTGRAPFVVEGDIHATIRALVGDEPPRASRLRPEIDRDLDALVMKAMAKRPADRYASIDELLRDLDRRERGDVLDARRGERRHVFFRSVRRHRGAIAAATLVFSALVGATIFSWRAQRNAERALERRDIQAERANDLARSFQIAIATSSPYYNGIGTTMAQFAEGWVRSIDRRPPRYPETEFTIRIAIAKLFAELGRSEEAFDQAARAIALAEKAKDVDRVQVIEALVVQHESLRARVRLDEAHANLEEIEKRARGIVAPVSDLGVTLRILRANDDIEHRRIDRAAEAVRRLFDDLDRVPNEHMIERVRVTTLDVIVTFERRDYAEAAARGKRAIELHRKVTGLKHAEAVFVMGLVAEAERRLGRIDDAWDTINLALTHGRATFRPTQSALTQLIYTAATIAVSRKDFESGAALCREVIAANEIEPSPDAAALGFSHRVVALRLGELGRYDESAAEAALAVKATAAVKKIDPPQVFDDYRVLTESLDLAKRPKDAYRASIEGLDVVKKIFPPRAREVIVLQVGAARRAMEADMLTESIDAYRATLAIIPDPTTPQFTSDRIAILGELARVLEEDDQDAEAEKVRAEIRRLRDR